MSTSATAIISKKEQAAQLREQSRTLTAELTKLRTDLANAAGSLAVLTEKKRAIAEEIADGKPHKPATLAALHADIAAAELPISVLQKRVTEKESALTAARDSLAQLDYELGLESQRAARQARLDALAKDGREIAGQVAEMLRVLVEEKLPAIAQVRDGLTEFINAGGQLNAGPVDAEGREARSVIHALEALLWDGPYLRCERALLKKGWTPRGGAGLADLTIRTLRPPK